jgi:hypothetical protein
MEILPTLFTGIATFLAGIGIERFKNRAIILEKTVNFQMIATTINNQHVGTIEILYNGGQSLNLYTAYIEIENTSNKNVLDFNLDVSVPDGFYIYRELTHLVQRELTMSVNLSEKYLKRREYVNQNSNIDPPPTDFNNEINYVIRHRQFFIPVLNKKSKVWVELLIDGPLNLEMVNVGIFKENVDLVFKMDNEAQKKTRMAIINILASLVYILCALPIMKYSTSVNYAVFLMLVNTITCYLITWAGYFTFLFFKSIFLR